MADGGAAASSGSRGARPSEAVRGPDARALGVVALGGVLGSIGRWALGVLVPTAEGGVPWATLTVNVSGALAMGMFAAYLASRPGAHRLLRPFAGVGLLGGWTTYSALAVEAVRLGAGHPQVALLYVAGTFLLGVLAVGAGLAAGRRVWS